MHRPIAIAASLSLAAVLSLGAQAAAPDPRPAGAAGDLALANRGGHGPASVVAGRSVLAPLLKPAYTLRLVSDWPQYGIAGTACVNGGHEMLTGRLIQGGDGSYTGTLERRTTIRFCGAHGAAQGEACALTLTSRGPVTARGEVLPSGGPVPATLLALRWSASPASGSGADDPVIEGDCAPSFMASLRTLYLGVSHAVEFPLPPAGRRSARAVLEQGWIVDVE